MEDRNEGAISFSVDENDKEWCRVGPWFDETIYQSLRGPLFE